MYPRLELAIDFTTNMETIKRSTSSSPEPALLSPSPVPEKSVHFYEFVTFSPSVAPLDLLLSVDEKDDLWYTMDDLLSFRHEVRETCRQLRLLDTAEAVETMKAPMLARDSLTRGLEQRTCAERQRRKYLTTQLVVRAAQKLRHQPEQLAALATKCTAWATALAVEEAARDFARAMRGRTTATDQVSRKRLLTPLSEPDSQRRVKARPTLIPTV